jgi:hypothetical protein
MVNVKFNLKTLALTARNDTEYRYRIWRFFFFFDVTGDGDLGDRLRLGNRTIKVGRLVERWRSDSLLDLPDRTNFNRASRSVWQVKRPEVLRLRFPRLVVLSPETDAADGRAVKIIN